jgi:[acyl-carrier-protein] S-malonyltransferase
MSDRLWFDPHPKRGAEIGDDVSRTIWLFPGLGCRHVGMGHDLFDRSGITTELIGLAEEVLGYSLLPICVEGSGRKVVRARQEAQVIHVLNCAYAAALGEQGYYPRAVLGHSLGSWSAAWVAGVYDFVTGLELVTHVERLLEEFVDGHDLSMGAIIGLDEFAVQSEVALQAGITVANFNSPAQFVIGGPTKAVDRVLNAAVLRGAKQAKRLPTSRAIHTPWLEEVASRLKPRLDLVEWSDPRMPFIPCDGARELGTGREVHQFLSFFLTRPVRWQLSFSRLSQTGASRFLEVGPGALLKSLASFIDSSAVVCAASDCLEAL